MTKIKKKAMAKEPSKNVNKPKKKPFKCNICSKAFSDRSYLTVHSALHKDETFPCPLCSYIAKTKKYLSRHNRQVHTERNQHKCTYCGKFFLHPSDLRDHTMVHTGEKPLSCNVCGKSFRVSYSLNTHMLIHTDEKPFRCSFCDYCCRDSSSLRKHQNKHMGLDTVYQCKICSKGYKSKWTLKIHVAEAHLDVDVKKVPCGQCDRRFKTVSQRNGHVKAKHKRALTCSCPVCGIRLANRYNLSDHMRRHMDERPFVCTHPGCKQAFKNKGCLQKHTKIHQPPLFECSYCGRKFVRKTHAARHEIVMHKERARGVQCDYCGAKFYSKNYLLKHIQTKHVHKHKFKYTCDICGLTTHNKPSIVMHLKYGHDNDNDLQCKLCDNKVVYKKHMYLKSHYWKTHNVKYKIDARRITRPKQAKQEEPRLNVQIKVEAVEAESYEDMDMIDVVKHEIASEEDNESLDYSKQVLSEDLTALVLRDGKLEGKEVDFDEFYIRHIMAKQEEKPDEPVSSVGVNKEQDLEVKRRIKHILIRTQKLEKAKQERKKKKEQDILRKEKEEEEARIREEAERQEIIELRRVRDLYNEKMKAAAEREKQKKEKVNIKYFKKKPEVSNTVTVIDADDLDKESTENDTTTNKSVTNDGFNDDTDDDNDNTPLNSLIIKTNSSVVGIIDDSTNTEDKLKKSSDNSGQNDENDSNLNTDEKDLPKQINENNADSDNMDIDEDLNIGNIVLIEGDTSINEDEVIGQLANKNNIDLSGNGDRVQNSDISHTKNYADVKNLESLGGGDKCYSDNTYIRNDEGNNCQQKNNEKGNVDKNLDKNNCDKNNDLQDSETAIPDALDKEVTNEQFNEGAKVIENDQQQSENDSDDVGNGHGIVKNVYDGNDDDKVINNESEVVSSETEVLDNDNYVSNNENEVITSVTEVVNNDNDVSNNENVVITSETEAVDKDDDISDSEYDGDEILNSDSDFNKPLIERKRKKKKSKKDIDYEVDDKDLACKKKAKKMEFKTHQCYVCFKLYQTKEELIKHCQGHFDLCNDRTLGKCPICNHVSNKLVAHMRRVHKVNIKVFPFVKLKDRKTTDGSRYCYEIDGGEIEVIPSVKILNKTASMEIDKKRREKKDKTISRTKLVKKGNAWIVEKEYLDLKFDELPELTDIELTKCKVTGNDIDRLGQISRIAKKKGLKMMFPCFECDKVCQNFSALKLHKRRHEVNPKPFAPRIKNGARSVKNENKIKLDKANRTALPKPIKTNHKCDDKLKEFYESNIRGGDIEFWQFLKIFNKMDREKVNDFKDLEERSDFGNHLDYYKDDDNDEMVEMAKEIDKYLEEGDSDGEVDDDNETNDDEVIAISGDE